MNKKPGVTLIELTISIGILALVIGVTSGILISIVKANQRAAVYNAIKRNGNYTLSVFKENIIGAKQIECVGSDCIAISYRDQNNNLKKLGHYVTADIPTCVNDYVYLMDYDPANPSDPSEKDKLTDDTSGGYGVNVKFLKFNIQKSTEATTVSVIMLVGNSCDTLVERTEEFRTSVVSRTG